MEALSVSVACRVTTLIAAILLPELLTSCGKKGPEGEKKSAQKSEDDFLDKDAKPDERKYLVAAKPFFIAVANRKYADAYALLSSHAKARMSFNQFTPAEEQATFQQYESNPYANVTVEQFAYLMQYVEAARGTPRAPKMLSVFSTDPDVLNRRSREAIRRDGLDVRHRRDARLDSRRHPAGELAWANPHRTLTSGT